MTSPIREAETADKRLSVADVLDRAADLIEPEGAWTQGDYARDDGGLGIGEYTEEEREKGGFEPVCFCTIGAVNHARGRDPDTALWGELRRPIWDVIGETNIADWNDNAYRTQAEVVAALRKAAEQSRAAAGETLGGYEAEGEVNKTTPLPAETEGRVKPQETGEA